MAIRIRIVAISGQREIDVDRRHLPRNIVLAGFMGSGKTSVGRQLAARLGWAFIDMDDIIVRREGKSISQIFAQHGEPYFRDLETALCREIAGCSQQVIATGGGAVLRPENRAILAGAGDLICLVVSADDVLRRVGLSSHRPLLVGPDPRRRIQELLEARSEVYAAIPIQIDTRELSVSQVVDRILAMWE